MAAPPVVSSTVTGTTANLALFCLLLVVFILIEVDCSVDALFFLDAFLFLDFDLVVLGDGGESRRHKLLGIGFLFLHYRLLHP